MKKEFNVTPWDVSGNIDYSKLVSEFGTVAIDEGMLKKLKTLHPLLRRGTYFSHRDFDSWLTATEQKKKVSVLTGRGPSERMHIGHLVPLFIAKSFQDNFNCQVYIPISDDEKFYVKDDLTVEKAIENSRDNILDIIALGFKPGKTKIFEDFVYTDIYKYAAQTSKKITYSTAKAVFGLKPENNIGWSFYPGMQAAHILFPQFLDGAQHTLVPVGIDQDPFIRLTRDIAPSFNFIKPSAIHAKFIPSLFGDAKMSSSGDGVIFLSDSEKEVEKKIKRYAFSGGQASIEEHRKKGGNPDIDVSYLYLKMFFEPDDKKLESIYDDYKCGKLLTGELKMILIEKVSAFLKEHQENKIKAQKTIDKYIIK